MIATAACRTQAETKAEDQSSLQYSNCVGEKMEKEKGKKKKKTLVVHSTVRKWYPVQMAFGKISKLIKSAHSWVSRLMQYYYLELRLGHGLAQSQVSLNNGKKFVDNFWADNGTDSLLRLNGCSVTPQERQLSCRDSSGLPPENGRCLHIERWLF